MAGLIDGVIQAGSYVGVQCLQFVNDVTHGAGAGFASAADLATSATQKGLLSQTPQLGDVAVWNAGVGGANAQYGHAGIVTAVSGSSVGITSTDWPNGSGAQQLLVGHGISQPSGYINPTTIGGNNIVTGKLPQAPPSGGVTTTVPGKPTLSLSQLISNVPGTGTPVVGPLVTGITFPVTLTQWFTQRGVWARGLFILVGAGITLWGIHLLTRQGGSSPVVNLISKAKDVAA